MILHVHKLTLDLGAVPTTARTTPCHDSSIYQNPSKSTVCATNLLHILELILGFAAVITKDCLAPCHNSFTSMIPQSKWIPWCSYLRPHNGHNAGSRTVIRSDVENVRRRSETQESLPQKTLSLMEASARGPLTGPLCMALLESCVTTSSYSNSM